MSLSLLGAGPSGGSSASPSWPFSDDFANFDSWTNYVISGSDTWGAAGGVATISHLNAGTTIAYYNNQGGSVDMEGVATTATGGSNTGCGPVVRGNNAGTCYCLQVSGSAASYGAYAQKWVADSLTEFSSGGSGAGDWKLTINGTTLTAYKWDEMEEEWEEQSQNTDSDISAGLYGGIMSRFWGGTGGTNTCDDWELKAIGACPEIALPPPRDYRLVWVPITGDGTSDNPYRANLPIGQRAGLKSDDSIPVDLTTGRPLLPVVPLYAPASVAGQLPVVRPDASSVWLWEAIRRTRRNAYFVPAGVHPRGEMHCAEYTWPSRPVPGGRVFYRPGPFASMPTAEGDADPDAAIEEALSQGTLDQLTGGRSEKAPGMIAKMVDLGFGGKFGAASHAVRRLAARGLAPSVVRTINQRFGYATRDAMRYVWSRQWPVEKAH